MSTIVAWPLKARSSTGHCTGSVSWNSSTSTIRQRCRIRARAGASSASSASASWLSRSSYDRTPSRRLRRSISVRTASAKRHPRPGSVPASSPAGSSRACGSPTARRAIASASGWVNGRRPRPGRRPAGRGRRPPRRAARRGPRPAGPRSRCRRRLRASPAPCCRTGGWSRSSPRRSPRAPRRPGGAAGGARRRRSRAAARSGPSAAGGAPGARSSASACSASTSWARTRSRSSWLAARPNVTTSICSSRAWPSAT